MTAFPPIVEQKIDSLSLSHSLKTFFRINKVDTLKDLLLHPMDEWFFFVGFSQHGLQDLMAFLRKHSLLSFVKD